MKKQNVLFLTIAFVLLTAASSFAKGTQPPPPAPEPQIFDRYVSIGDSLTHGFQSGAVDETRQPTTYPNLIAQKMATEFNQPLLKFPGYLVNIEDVLKGNIAWYEYYYPLVGGERVDGYDDQAILNNFGITGSESHNGLNTRGSEGGFFKLVLGPDGASQVQQALDRDPTFVSFWLCNNDVLGSALTCDTGALTPFSDFQRDFGACVEAIAKDTIAEDPEEGTIMGAVLLNVPDVTTIAYLQYTTNPDLPDDSMNPFWMARASSNMALTPDDIALIQQRTDEINAEVEYVASANNFAFVDANAKFNDIKAYGHNLRDVNGNATGQTITAEYLGGLFSLDGVHPSVTGQAVAANYIIDEINMTYGTSHGINLGPVNETAAAASDTLLQDPVDPRNLIDGWVADAIYFVVELFM
jgi:lysophospholipase L1-like esterase